MIPKPGVYQNIPDAEYRSWEAVSQSSLKHFLRSPAHYKHVLANPKKPTEAMILGTFIDDAVYDLEAFQASHVCMPKLDLRKTEDKATKAKLIAQYGEANLVHPDDWETVIQCTKSLHAHPSCQVILSQKGDTELSIVWEDAETGLLLKGRIDRYIGDLGFVVDIKSSKDASPFEFAKSVYNLGIHIQMATYRRGCLALGLPFEGAFLFAVETEAPYLAAAYQLDRLAIEAGDVSVGQILRGLKECQETDQWPGYSDEIVAIGIPSWAHKQIEATE